MRMVKKSFLIYVSLIVVLIVITLKTIPLMITKPHPQHAISFTYIDYNGFGDRIRTYTAAQLLSYKYDIPFYTIPFKYDESLAIKKVDSCLDENVKKRFDRIIQISSESDLVEHLRSSRKSTLFIINLGTALDFSSILHGLQWADNYDNLYCYSRQHSLFGSKLKRALTISIPVPKISLPSDAITVAVHVRKGEPEGLTQGVQYIDEFEKIRRNKIKNLTFPHFVEEVMALKFPPEQFYVDQIKKLSAILNHLPLFVYVFTNDKNPKQIVERFKKRINLPNISFACREKSIHDSSNKYLLIEEIYNMSRFDCLIRGGSGFSWIAQMMGSHKIIVHPQKSVFYASEKFNQGMLQIAKTTIFFSKPNANATQFFSFDTITQEHKQKALDLFGFSMLNNA